MATAAQAALAAALLLAGALASRWIRRARRRQSLIELMVGGETDPPVEEPPRLRNRWRVERLISNRTTVACAEGAAEPVLLRYLITSSGRPAEMTVLRSSGSPAFDRVVLRAMRWARFHPARLLGRPVTVWVEQPVTFTGFR